MINNHVTWLHITDHSDKLYLAHFYFIGAWICAFSSFYSSSVLLHSCIPVLLWSSLLFSAIYCMHSLTAQSYMEDKSSLDTQLGRNARGCKILRYQHALAALLLALIGSDSNITQNYCVSFLYQECCLWCFQGHPMEHLKTSALTVHLVLVMSQCR